MINQIYNKDCSELLVDLEKAEIKIDLIYIDPPFFTRKKQQINGLSYNDFQSATMEEYANWLSCLINKMKDLLKSTGSIYVHLDWHAVHYIKVEMDKIFGYDNFLNHIVWCYGLGGSSSRVWSRKHDDILWYAQNKDSYHYNAESILIPCTSNKLKGQLKKETDCWNIPTINNMAKERVGYPTQKPEALLERIIESSCPIGSLVADFFCGSGTSMIVAKKLGRKYIGCDTNQDAVEITNARLASFLL